MTQVDWIVVAIAAATYVATAVRAAMAAGRFGRRWPVWLAITLLGTAIPAMIVFYRDAKRKMREMPARVVQPPEEEKQPVPRRSALRDARTAARCSAGPRCRRDP